MPDSSGACIEASSLGMHICADNITILNIWHRSPCPIWCC